jgi:calcineurin-like phosphoesterase family protein
MGYKHEIQNFCKWFNNLSQYTTKIFIAGNHDWGFQDNSEEIAEVVKFYKNITYLQDDLYCIGDDYASMIKIWGAPWQPEFHNWAFNLPRNSPEMWEKMLLIPENTDILMTHGPAHGSLDTTEWDRSLNLGCEMLTERIAQVKPKIHVCGHIHSGYGYRFDGTTHYFNAAVLGESYQYQNKPLTFEWDKDTNQINFL